MVPPPACDATSPGSAGARRGLPAHGAPTPGGNKAGDGGRWRGGEGCGRGEGGDRGGAGGSHVGIPGASCQQGPGYRGLAGTFQVVAGAQARPGLLLYQWSVPHGILLTMTWSVICFTMLSVTIKVPASHQMD